MNLTDLISRNPQPIAWQEGDNIPWNEPGFSARMLKEHLSQEHDAASRRTFIIDRHVAWIHHFLLKEQPSRVLDLGCGPGLYASRLAQLGHTCTGVDYSPASIAYARQTAEQEGLNCHYIQEDIRQADLGQGYDLATLIYGELCVFSPQDARKILGKVWDSLKPGGQILLEPHTWEAVHKMGNQPRSWYTATQGLFSDQPYLYLQENTWNATTRTATIRYYIVEAGSATVTRYAQALQAYTREEYQSLLESVGFTQVCFYSSLAGDQEYADPDLIALTAYKDKTLG